MENTSPHTERMVFTQMSEYFEMKWGQLILEHYGWSEWTTLLLFHYF